MKCYLFTDSDTRLQFKNRAKAFIYAERNLMPAMVLTEYDDQTSDFKFSVFNPFLKTETCIEYFKSESDALKYISNFI